MKQKTFSEHYGFAMSCFGLTPLKLTYADATQVGAWIHGMNVYFETYGTKSTLSHLFLELAKLKKYNIAKYRVGVGNHLLGMAAAFYAGLHIGVFML